MKFRMAENSLFAILLRSSWWISLAIAVGLTLAAVAWAPSAWKVYAAFVGAPFFVIAAIAGWRQLRAPSATRIEQVLGELRAMSAAQFADAVEQRLRAEGFEVTRVNDAAVDFEARRASRLTLVSCRRFKAARAGVRPLQELGEAIAAREADDGVYLAVNALSDQARQLAARTRIRVLEGAELAAWFPAPRGAKAARAR